MQFFSKRVHLGDTYYTFFITFARNILFDTSRTQHYKDLIHSIHMKNVLLLVSTILLFVCCTSSKERKTLQQAESVVCTTPDSANKLFKQVSFSNLRSEKDKAYYALLKSIIAYRLYERQPLRDINYALSYYKQHSDYRYLQMAYFYHGAVNKENGGDIIVSMRDFKEAEMLISKTCNKVLESYIYSALIGIFFLHNVNNLGLEYSNKSIALAKAMNDKETLSGAYGNKAIFDERNGESDSALAYYKLSIKYIDYVKYIYDKAYTYDNIAFYYDNHSDIDSAKKYHSLAAQCTPNDSTFSIWNQLYNCKDFYKAIQKSKTISPSNLFEEYNLYVILSHVARENGINQMAFKYSDMTDSIQDLIDNDRYKSEIIEVHKEYLSKEQKATKHNAICTYAIILTIVIILSFLTIYYIRKHNKKQLLYHQQKIELLLQKIIAISSSLSSKNECEERLHVVKAQQEETLIAMQKELRALKEQRKKRIAESKKELDQLANGLDITLKILQGEPVKLIEKKDRIVFIQLHSINNSIFKDIIIPLTTIQDQVFFILLHLGLKRERIQEVLCISDDAFRKEKSRLLNKLISQDGLDKFCDNLRSI